MSATPAQVTHTPGFRARESYGEKVWRKFKQEPLVPIGTCATICAFLMAAFKLGKRDSRSVNYWLRARIAGQLFTIGAVYVYYQRREQDKATLQQSADEQYAEREKREFEGRLKVAEAQWKESHGNDQKTDAVKKEANSGSSSGSSWWRMNWLWKSSSSSAAASEKKPS